MQAAIAMAGWAAAMFSMSIELIHSPPGMSPSTRRETISVSPCCRSLLSQQLY
jgi:hypothetical protein